MGDERHASRSAQRAIDILLALADGPDTVGVTALARTLALSKGTVHRLLQTLVAGGLVSYMPASQSYRLGGGALRLGLRVMDRLPLRREAYDTLHELRDRTGETAALFMAVGDRSVAVEQAVTHQVPRRILRLGSTIPLHAGATGRVMLAYYGTELRQRYMQKAVAAGGTQVPIAGLDVLDAELQSVRGSGYCISILSDGVPTNSLAFPLLNGSGALLGCITVVGPPSRWTDDVIKIQLPVCQSLVEQLCLRLKYMEPDTAAE